MFELNFEQKVYFQAARSINRARREGKVPRKCHLDELACILQWSDQTGLRRRAEELIGSVWPRQLDAIRRNMVSLGLDGPRG